MGKATIDTDLAQVIEEVKSLRRRLTAYLTQREKERYTMLMARMAQLTRVIALRDKEHEEGER
ncbi:hypothetical protein UFOVP698_39 [uncultured Caudovirales phage]|uniref:Uncharacterized protein n=1 Tax=uncultured Caudovirales phage TaxID=2100421 RepID=A0A6J5NIU7_9CAUD|nr:hypothetical protein UFOVP698_39 [uncultured Caudovirales phage]